MEWTEAELNILQYKPPEPICDWMESNFIMAGNTADPGRYSFAGRKFLRKIAESFEHTRETVIRKPSQIGYSWLFIGLMSWAIMNEPGDILLVFPTEESGAKFLNSKIYPAWRRQGELLKLLPKHDKDWTAAGIDATKCQVHLGFSGSPTSLSSNTIRYVFADEISKFQGSGKEADPIRLMKKRQSEYTDRARTIYGCTPTHDQDEICKLFDSSGEQYFYHLECPFCKRLFLPTTEQVKWVIPEQFKETIQSREKYLKEHDVVRLECPHCLGRLDNTQKGIAVDRGRWLGKDQYQNASGEIVGEEYEAADRKAFQLHRLLSPTTTLLDYALEFQQCIYEPHHFKDFANSIEGLPYKETAIEITSADSQYLTNQIGVRKAVPHDNGYLIAAADTQDNLFHWAIWNITDVTAHLVDYGIAQDTQALSAVAFASYGNRTPEILCIDARGHRTAEIYHYATTDSRIIAVTGSSTRLDPPFRKSQTADYNAKAYSIDTIHYKDRFFDWLQEKKITTFAGIDSYWHESIAAERKVAASKNGRTIWHYEEVIANKNHQLDCSVYAFFGYNYLVANTNNSLYQPKQRKVIPVAPLINTGNSRGF